MPEPNLREPEPITEAEMRVLLGRALKQDPEYSFLGQLLRHLKDPTAPPRDKEKLRLHPVWLAVGLFVVCVISVFLCFTLARS